VIADAPRVYERPTKFGATWCGDIYVTTPAGQKRRVRRALPGATDEATARAIAVSLQGAIHELVTAPPAPERLTFKEFVEREWVPRRKHRFKPATWRGYEQILRVHLVRAFGRLPLVEIRVPVIEDFIANKKAAGRSEATINKQLSVLSTVLCYAVKWERLAASPMDGVERFVVRQDPAKRSRWSESELRVLLETTLAVAPRWYPMLVTSLYAGLRLGELAALRKEDVDLERALLTVNRAMSAGIEGTPKSGRPREIPLTSEVVAILRGHLAGVKKGAFVFTSDQGAVLNHNNVKAMWRRVRAAAGLRALRFHDNRHTFASMLVDADVGAHKLRALMGHSDLRTTQLYVHESMDALREAVARPPAPPQVPASAPAPEPPARAGSRRGNRRGRGPR
jgi:integrase